MDLKQIKELMAAMQRAGIKKLTLKQKSGDEVHLERQDEHAPPAHTTAFYPPPSLPQHTAPPMREMEGMGRPSGIQKPVHEEPARGGQTETAGKYVLAPLVGTYYSAASPEDPAFVKVGDKVSENTVVCIIEAMKVMNEVKAGMSGTIEEVLLENAHPVEFGTKLFRIV